MKSCITKYMSVMSIPLVYPRVLSIDGQNLVAMCGGYEFLATTMD